MYMHKSYPHTCIYIPFTRSKNILDRDLDSNLNSDLDLDPEDVPVYTRHSLFNSTKCITLSLMVQSLVKRLSLPQTSLWSF